MAKRFSLKITTNATGEVNTLQYDTPTEVDETIRAFPSPAYTVDVSEKR